MRCRSPLVDVYPSLHSTSSAHTSSYREHSCFIPWLWRHRSTTHDMQGIDHRQSDSRQSSFSLSRAGHCRALGLAHAGNLQTNSLPAARRPWRGVTFCSVAQPIRTSTLSTVQTPFFDIRSLFQQPRKISFRDKINRGRLTARCEESIPPCDVFKRSNLQNSSVFSPATLLGRSSWLSNHEMAAFYRAKRITSCIFLFDMASA